ncbi:MAG: hypothetical protein Q9160_000955 [Pyrenula sp. 1 TL-2023]
MFISQTLDGRPIPIALCIRCAEDVFSEEGWSKLLGTHPNTPGTNESSDACFDGEFTYSIMALGGKTLPPRRSPISRHRIAVEDLLESVRDDCGFCHLVADLDKEDHLAAGKYEKVILDLQLFAPKRFSDITIRSVLQASLTLEGEGMPAWKKSRLLTMTSEDFDAQSDKSSVRENSNHQGGSGFHFAISRLFCCVSRPILPRSSQAGAEMSRTTHPLLRELGGWIEECEGNHPRCALSQEPKLPRRVIDVLPSGDASRIKLLENTDSPRGRYVALSYVWGTRQTLRLLHSTLGSFMEGVAVEDLPKTIQDAVEVTRVLNIKYLWVDSLCILQDSIPDKETQIPYMSDYYHGAVAVISASGATDVHAGFLKPQETEGDVRVRLRSQIITSHSEFGTIPYRIPFIPPDVGPILCLVDTKPRLYSYDDEPINKRGWTLQESALARRLLTFPSTGGLIMRCNEGERAAGRIRSNPFHEGPDSPYISTQDYPNSAHPSEELFDGWAAAVQDYSRRFLSYQSDILVALGALAQEFHTRNGPEIGTYIAGLWSNMLLEGLLWHISQPPHSGRASYIPPSRTTSEYHAPSWSWASCGQPIAFRTEREPDLSFGKYTVEEPRWCIEILHWDITPQSKGNPFGAVKAGYLDIKGFLMPLRRVPIEDQNTNQCDVEDIALASEENYSKAESDLFAPDLVDSLASIDSSCYWLPLYDATRARYRGLIVRQVNAGSYRRLGFAEFMFYTKTLDEAKKQTIRLV